MIYTIINILISIAYVILLSFIYLTCFKDRDSNWYNIHILKRRVAQFVIVIFIVNTIKTLRYDFRHLLSDYLKVYDSFYLIERICVAVILFIIIRVRIEFTKNGKHSK